MTKRQRKQPVVGESPNHRGVGLMFQLLFGRAMIAVALLITMLCILYVTPRSLITDGRLYCLVQYYHLMTQPEYQVAPACTTILVDTLHPSKE